MLRDDMAMQLLIVEIHVPSDPTN